MNVLDHQSTKKSRDDSRIHHILDDAMFKPRKRVSKGKHNDQCFSFFSFNDERDSPRPSFKKACLKMAISCNILIRWDMQLL